jgi:hypothetical protein
MRELDPQITDCLLGYVHQYRFLGDDTLVRCWIEAEKQLERYYGVQGQIVLSMSSLWGVDVERMPYSVLARIAEKEGLIYRSAQDDQAALNDAIARRFGAFYLLELLAAKREAS